VNFGDKRCAIHGNRELGGLFGGAWNSSSSTRVVGNTVDGSSARQCSFEAPVDLKTNKSIGRSSVRPPLVTSLRRFFAKNC
jgi:hypothetical protein